MDQGTFSCAISDSVHSNDCTYGGTLLAPGIESQVPSTFLPFDNVNGAWGMYGQLVNNRDANIMNAHQIIFNDNKCLIALEASEPVLDFFKKKMLSWREKGLYDKVSWYNFIKDDFTNLFRKVVRMFFKGVDHKRYDSLSSNLAKSLFITDSGERAKFLPLFDTQSSSVDLNKLQLLMSSIIGLPFEMTDVIGYNSGFNLTSELSSFLFYLDNQNLRFVGPKFILRAPFTWFERDKYDFIHNLDHLIKVERINKQAFSNILKNDLDIRMWRTLVAQNPVLDQILKYSSQPGKKGFSSSRPGKKGVSSSQSGQKGLDSYPFSADLVRFCTNAYRHYNDIVYWHLRGGKYVEQMDIEKALTAVIPDLYCKLFDGLLNYASEYEHSTNNRLPLFEEAFTFDHF